MAGAPSGCILAGLLMASTLLRGAGGRRWSSSASISGASATAEDQIEIIDPCPTPSP